MVPIRWSEIKVRTGINQTIPIGPEFLLGEVVSMVVTAPHWQSAQIPIIDNIVCAIHRLNMYLPSTPQGPAVARNVVCHSHKARYYSSSLINGSYVAYAHVIECSQVAMAAVELPRLPKMPSFGLREFHQRFGRMDDF
jgi:hypothetical protein